MKNEISIELKGANLEDSVVLERAAVATARMVLSNEEKARRWLHKPNRALSGDTPCDGFKLADGLSGSKRFWPAFLKG